MTSPPILNYFKRTDRRWGKRLALAALLCVAVGAMVAWNWRALVSASRNEYEDWRFRTEARAFTLPPTQVVYEEDPARVSQLCLSDPRFIRDQINGGGVSYPLTFEVRGGPGCQFAFFLHERRSRNGHIHIVQLAPVWMDRNSSVGIGYCFVERNTIGALLPGLAPVPSSREIVRIFAGQPDAADASHFSLVYNESDGKPGVIDGWLMDDDTVKLQVRTP